MSFITALRTTVDRLAFFVKSESQLERLATDGTALESPLTKLLGKVVEDLDVMCDVGGVVLRNDGNATQDLAFDDILRILVA